MSDSVKIGSALISVYDKQGLEPVLDRLSSLGVALYSTGGTAAFIRSNGYPCIEVESLTGYPSILGGRVKTLHPLVFGGILMRRGLEADLAETKSFDIPPIDLVIVDLYPFEATVASGAKDEEIIEQVDIGGVSLLRAAAKNFADVLVISSSAQYARLEAILEKGHTTLDERRLFATESFAMTSAYDAAIFGYFNRQALLPATRLILSNGIALRYGENPHQPASFYGRLDALFEQLAGKEISYNNLVDIDAALQLIGEMDQAAFVVIKHTNACGAAIADNGLAAWHKALSCDPISAFGGVLATNRIVDEDTANSLNELFFEVLLSPGFEKNALTILEKKKNRILLQVKPLDFQPVQYKTLLNGTVMQHRDTLLKPVDGCELMAGPAPENPVKKDLQFANTLVKHLKSNAIVLVKNGKLLGAGCGMTSRVDAVKHAIAKAHTFGHSLEGAVMASDAFFPFADSVELAFAEGIQAVIEPGGSLRDQDTIAFCQQQGITLLFTGLRHFKH